MRKLEAKKGYYANEDNSIVGKVIYFPDSVDIGEFRLISEAEGKEIVEKIHNVVGEQKKV